MEATYDGCNHLAKCKISTIAWQRNEGKGVFRCKVLKLHPEVYYDSLLISARNTSGVK